MTATRTTIRTLIRDVSRKLAGALFGPEGPSPERRVLRYLAGRRSARGLDVVDGAGVSRGSVYVLLARLRDQGLVESWPDERDEYARHRYRITDAGRRLL